MFSKYMLNAVSELQISKMRNGTFKSAYKDRTSIIIRQNQQFTFLILGQRGSGEGSFLQQLYALA
ncbi:MAG: hypothetical protein DSO07_07065 [Thermoproteota archaeon]|nr:MAG: hypothetical protein DSO07_07065 [Candidatus Korarchaeota archaeon]